MANYDSQNRYHRDKMLQVKASFKTDFVLEFREALSILDLKQADVIREAMILTIEKAKKQRKK